MRQDDEATLDTAFRLTLDLAGVTEHRGWREAREQALAALAAGQGLIALLGPAGTGKTLLLRDLARSLRATGQAVQLVGRGDLPFDAGAGEVVLVDEAARTDAATLDRLCASGAAVILADLPGLEARLDNHDRPAAVVRLAPLRTDEVGAFVADRLTRAGQLPDMLTAGAVAALALHSSGIPRVLNLLARAALFVAASEGTEPVEGRHVDLAVALREGMAPEAEATSSDAEASLPMPAAGPGIPALLGVMGIELPSAVPECLLPTAPPSRSRVRGICRCMVLLAAGAAAAAALVAWPKLGPPFARMASTALMPAAVAPSRVSEPPATNSAAETAVGNGAGAKAPAGSGERTAVAPLGIGSSER